MQTGAETFSCENSKDESITISKKRWGSYPVLVLNYKPKNKKERYDNFILLGLNSPGQWVLAFEFIYPEKDKFPNEDMVKIWQNLLNHTREVIPKIKIILKYFTHLM